MRIRPGGLRGWWFGAVVSLLLGAGTAAPASGQESVGQVVDADSGAPLAGVSIRWEQGEADSPSETNDQRPMTNDL